MADTSLDKKFVAKMKRRIRRTIETGVRQARVHKVSEKIYEYKEVHRVKHHRFRVDKLGRLYRLF